MSHHTLLPVALQQWEEFTPHALIAREVAVTLAKGSGAKLSVLSLYEYGKMKESGLSLEMAARYREGMIQRIEGLMETKMKAFLADVQGMDIAISSIVQAGEPHKAIIDMAERLPADLLVIGAQSKRRVSMSGWTGRPPM
jgi:nucleotide-binding universal stress UspA family protein